MFLTHMGYFLAFMDSTPIITSTAHELQQRLQSGRLDSVALVKRFFDQIKKHNHEGMKLNALLSVCPEEIAVAQAAMLDLERKRGIIRSKLHGIPIVLKDALVTSHAMGMPTTAGSYAFASMKAVQNAPVAQKFIDAGLIILGKANMTEFCGLKSNDTPIGWSAYGGQTLSPYRRNGLEEKDQAWAGGSSSGSAASVRAGFSPLGIGTETGGSNTLPTSCHGLYGLTFRDESAPTGGLFRLSETFDSVGLMARDPTDIAALVEVLGGAAFVPENALNTSWDGLSVGILPNTWGVQSFHDSVEGAKWDSPDVKEKYTGAAEIMTSRGAKAVYPVEMPEGGILTHKGETLHTIAYHEFPSKVQEFISYFEPDPQITSLADVISWNERNAAKALPDPYTTQTELITSQNNDMSPSTHDEAVSAIRKLARETVDATMRSHSINIVLAASDSNLVGYSSWAGWSIATVPLGNLAKNGQPFGFSVMARDGRVDLLLRFMAAFHATFPAVEAPTTCFEG